MTPASLSALRTTGEKECIQPPKNFDLKTLSDDQLALYGLPTRSILDSAHSFWSGLLAHYKHRACGPGIRVTGGLRNTTGAGGNWAGNWAVGTRGTYRLAQVTFTMPGLTGNIGAMAAFWAGVGGRTDITSPQTLVQAGESVMACPAGYTGAQCLAALNAGALPKSGSTWRYNFPWYEIVNSDNADCTKALEYCQAVAMTGIATYTGNSMTAYVDSNYGNAGYDYFQVCDNTSNTCTSPVYNSNYGEFSDSATGECVAEEPPVTNSGGSDYYVADFGSVGLNDCLITNSSGTQEGVGLWPHNYGWIKDNAGGTLVAVGSVANNENFAVDYCAAPITTDNFCG